MSEDVHWNRYAGRFRVFPTLIPTPPLDQTALIVCIPILAEEQLTRTLNALWESRTEKHYAEVLLLFNTNKFMTEAEIHLHHVVWQETLEWCDVHKDDCMRFFPIYIDLLPNEEGGVGWARKLVMDEAARRLGPEGIMVCLDGDCIVQSNYIDAINSAFAIHSSLSAASIYFEHRYEDLPSVERNAIIKYELHLRYLVQAQKWAGHPFAFHTVGSAMAVRRNAYLTQGGMNTRRAGEDFYFLKKFIETGSFFEIRTTTVYPSARISHRVPFGTGRAMDQIANGINWRTTNFASFSLIRVFFEKLEALYLAVDETTMPGELGAFITDQQPSLMKFLEKINFLEKVKAIKNNTTSYTSFQKRFFRFFNAFQMIRYMHFMRDHGFPDAEVIDAVKDFFQAKEIQVPASDLEAYLIIMRRLDRQLNQTDS